MGFPDTALSMCIERGTNVDLLITGGFLLWGLMAHCWGNPFNIALPIVSASPTDRRMGNEGVVCRTSSVSDEPKHVQRWDVAAFADRERMKRKFSNLSPLQPKNKVDKDAI